VIKLKDYNKCKVLLAVYLYHHSSFKLSSEEKKNYVENRVVKLEKKYNRQQ